MDFGIDIESGKEWIKRTRRRLSHECIINGLVIHITRLVVNMTILFLILLRLGKTGLLFVYRLDDKDTRIVFSQVQKQGTTVFEHGNELFVSGPCRIKEDVIAEMSDAVYYITGIVQRTIVGIQLDDCQAERSGLLRLFRIPFGRELSQIHFVEAMSINAADKAVRIPGCFR